MATCIFCIAVAPRDELNKVAGEETDERMSDFTRFLPPLEESVAAVVAGILR